MTRRKQDAPQRLHGLESSRKSLHVKDSVDRKLVISDNGAEDGDGVSSSDEDTTGDMHVDVHSVLDSRLVSRPSTRSSPCTSTGGHMSHSGQGQQFTCHINGSSVGCGGEVCSSNSSSTLKQQTSEISHLTEAFPPSEPLSRSNSCTSIILKQNSSTSSIASSLTPSSTVINPRMALVLPVGLAYSSQNAQNHVQTGLTHFSATRHQHDDQPLDLSRKAVRSASFSSTETKLMVLRNRSCSDSVTHMPLPTNNFSSLRSLQQRFGDDVPLHPSHKSAAMVIPLPANITCKSVMSLNGVWTTEDAPPSTRLERLHPMSQVDLSEERDVTQSSAVLGVTQGESIMAVSPVLGDEPVSVGWSRHTTHRCSCQNTFSTLYSLSLHLQETGHTPSSSKRSSPMDYPKLVRGQDMWLNQESEQTRRILRCIQCGQSFESLPLLTVHMMQTQHYAKIVNSDHVRRPHKCSTYCGRELDQECIFKCKVCHETFGDMGGLANHMVASGHHRKPLASHVANPVTLSSDVSTISRHGKRKRCFQDDPIPIAIAPNNCTAASLLNYRRTQNGVSKRGEKDSYSELDANGGNVSPDFVSPGLVTCDICRENVTTLSLNSHARECLKQKVEVIEKLRNKLNLEDALLSRSEGKLLKANFSLDSATRQQKGISTDREKSRAGSASSEDQVVGRRTGSEKGLSEYSMEMFPERSHSLPSSDLTQMIRLSASPRTRLCASPSAKLNASPSATLCVSPSARLTTSPSAKLSASPSTRLCASPSVILCASPSTRFSTAHSTRLSSSPSTRLCASPSDLHEVPRKKWCPNGDSRQEVNKTSNLCVKSTDDDNWPVNFNKRTASPTINAQFTAGVQNKDIDQSTLHAEVAHKIKSEPRHRDSVGCDSERDLVSDALIKVEQHSERLSSPSHVMESRLESFDCTYSALYQLDLFSRGLQLSPPRRTISLEHKLPIHQQSKVPNRQESLPTHIRSPSSRSPPRVKSPHIGSSSPLHLKSESPSPSKINMTFNIIDPNVEPQGVASAPSALEAMESFINKSFCAKPQICSPSLTSMFSPFINCFPNPGSLLPHGGFLLDSANATSSQLAKFSRFFRMMPGIPVYSEIASSPAVDKIKRGTNINRSQLDSTSTAALLSLSEYHLRTFAPIPSVKASVGRYKLESPKAATIYTGDGSSMNISEDFASAFKKQDHTFCNSSELMNAQKIHRCKSAADSSAVQESHQVCSSPGGFVVEKKHKYCSSANSLIAQQKCRSPDTSAAHKNGKFGRSDSLIIPTIGHDHYRTGDTISGNLEAEAYCTDENLSQRLLLGTPLNSLSQRLHVEPINVELERKGSEELPLHLATVSSKRRDAGLGYSQPGDELVTDVKSGGDEEDAMWEDDTVVTNNEIITEVTEAARSEGEINNSSQANTELENNEGNIEVKKSLDGIVVENSQVNSQTETTKLTFQIEFGRREDNTEINESEVDKKAIVKTESGCLLYEGKRINETIILNPNEGKARATNLNLSLEVHENKTHVKLTVTDEFRQKLKQEAGLDGNDAEAAICSSTNMNVNKNDVSIKDDIQQEVGKAVTSVDVCKDIQAGSLKDIFGNEHFHESSKLNSFKPDSQNETVFTKLATSWTRSVLVKQEVLPGRSVLCSNASSEDCDISRDDSICDTSNMDLDTDNRVDDVKSDEARQNIEKGQCKEVDELRVDQIDHNNARSDKNASKHVSAVSINNVTSAENNKNGIDRDCASSGNHCENEAMFKARHSENKIHCRNVNMLGTSMKHFNGGHVQNKGTSTHFTKISTSGRGGRGSSIFENKSFVQSVNKLTNIKPECIEKSRALQNDMIKDRDYTTTSLQVKKHHGISVQTENEKCLSEGQSNVTTNALDRLKKKKSALDYLSSFVYSQPQSTEHPLDNLQRLLSTNDLTYLPTNPDNHLLDVSHTCCSSDMLTTQSIISMGGQACGTEGNEDDESCVTESGTSEGDVHHYKCVACRRRFASKGSYRYHLSRCHLSGVKKYSIKETFSRSPYVYLPLDHTVKLSKYYQMTQQLSHEGK